MGSVISNAPDDDLVVTASEMGVYGGPTDSRWFFCAVCGFEEPIENLAVFEGKRYCIPRGCYLDIQGIIRQKSASRTKVPKDNNRDYRVR